MGFPRASFIAGKPRGRLGTTCRIARQITLPRRLGAPAIPRYRRDSGTTSHDSSNSKDRWFFEASSCQNAGCGLEGFGGGDCQFSSVAKASAPDQTTPFLRSRKLHSAPPVAAALPFICRAPDFRFGPKRALDLANASSTKLRLPITAPSVK